VVLTLICALLLILIWFPIARIPSHYQIGYNEGYNAYWQQTAAGGGLLYGKPPTVAYTNYPPLSLHLVGWLGGLTGDRNIAGRWISLLAYLGIGCSIAIVVRRVTGAIRHGAFAGLCWLIWIAAFDPSRIGQNDPHLLGMCLGFAGLCCYVHRPESTRWLALSGAAFALSVFTKQSLVALPCAVGLHLILTSRRRFVIWAGVGAASALFLLLLTFQVDGAWFFQHLAIPRTYSLVNLTGSTAAYVFFFQAPICVALIAGFRLLRLDWRSIFVFAFLLAHAAGIVYTAGAGAGVNHLFDGIATICLLAGVLLPEIENLSASVRYPPAFLAVLLMAPFFLGTATVIPQRVPDDWARFQWRSQAEAGFASARNFIRAQPGDALCESLLLCYEAGKPETWDPFVIGQLIQSRQLDERRILAVAATRGFGVIQIDLKYDEPPNAREHISAGFTNQLLATYQLALRTPDFAVFTPKPR
jgi:dolichyl-phosphate-mannose-protein mannosyltransferase